MDFINRNQGAASLLSQETGLNASFILAWAGMESGYGVGSAASLDNNNFFGLTAPTGSKAGAWLGAVACSAKTGKAFSGFACFGTDEMNDLFGGNNLYYSGYGALLSFNGRYLTAALSAQDSGGTIMSIANAIAKAGFNSEPGNYGKKVSDSAQAIAKRMPCPQ